MHGFVPRSGVGYNASPFLTQLTGPPTYATRPSDNPSAGPRSAWAVEVEKSKAAPGKRRCERRIRQAREMAATLRPPKTVAETISIQDLKDPEARPKAMKEVVTTVDGVQKKVRRDYARFMKKIADLERQTSKSCVVFTSPLLIRNAPKVDSRGQRVKEHELDLLRHLSDLVPPQVGSSNLCQ